MGDLAVIYASYYSLANSSCSGNNNLPPVGCSVLMVVLIFLISPITGKCNFQMLRRISFCNHCNGFLIISCIAE